MFGAIGMTQPSRVLGACSRRLARRGVLAFSLPHSQRTGAFPASPRTRDTVALPDGTTHTVEHWDMDPAAWARALNRAGLLVTGVLQPPRASRRPLAHHPPDHRTKALNNSLDAPPEPVSCCWTSTGC